MSKRKIGLITPSETKSPFASSVQFAITARSAFRGDLIDYELGVKLIRGKNESEVFAFEGGRVHLDELRRYLGQNGTSSNTTNHVPFPVDSDDESDIDLEQLPPVVLLIEKLEKDKPGNFAARSLSNLIKDHFARRGKLEIDSLGSEV